MPTINANFQFESMQPNFERDSMTYAEMVSMSKLKLDIGHIVYCRPDEGTAEEAKHREGFHYIFLGGDSGLNFDVRWKKIRTEEELVFWTVDITNGTYDQEDGSITFTSDIGDRSWNELKSIGENNQLLILVLIKIENENRHKIFMPCNIDDLGAVINISSRHLTGMSTGGYELYLNCLQDRSTTPWGIIGGGKLYYYEDTISNDYINNLN